MVRSANTLGRECTNPRPCEYREIHRLTRRYVVGSVSYSEGITDDVNKCVWSDMDFFPDVDVRDSLEDYSRLYFPSLPASEPILLLRSFGNNSATSCNSFTIKRKTSLRSLCTTSSCGCS